MTGITQPRLPGLVEHHQKVAQALIESIEDGTAPWVRAWEPDQEPPARNLKTGSAYKGSNRALLAARANKFGFTDARWGTRKQIKELGGRVRKGEKGYRIRSWQFEAARPAHGEDGKPVLDQDGEPAVETVRLPEPRVRSTTVYNADQATGLPKDTAREQGGAGWDSSAAAEEVLRECGADLRHKADCRGPSYDVALDRITLPLKRQYPSAETYYQSAFHELAHWTGHPARLSRDTLVIGLVRGPMSPHYAREELRAEISSVITGHALGLGHDTERTASYVGAWVKMLRKDPMEIHRACRDAEAISDYILNRAVLHERAQELRAPKPRPAAQQAPPRRRPKVLFIPQARARRTKRLLAPGR